MVVVKDVGIFAQLSFIPLAFMTFMAEVLGVSFLRDSKYIEIILATFIYFIFVKKIFYKKYFSAEQADKSKYIQPNDMPLTFVAIGFLSILIASLIMLLFGIRLSNHMQAMLEITTICIFQYLLIRTITKPCVLGNEN
jgi:H+/Cl- antiporter ClcA